MAVTTIEFAYDLTLVHSVLLRRQCNTLSTSGFVDDVMFSHNGAHFTFAVVTCSLTASVNCAVWPKSAMLRSLVHDGS